MRKIISSIDVGNNFIKLIIGEVKNDKLHVLSATKVATKGINDDKIVNAELLINSVKEAVQNVSKTLGVEVKKVVLGVNSKNVKLIKATGAVSIINEESIITGKDVNAVMQNCTIDKIPNNYVLTGIIPVEFTIDGDVVVDDPKGKNSGNLGLKAVLVASPRDYISSLLNIMTLCGLKVVDVMLSSLGDYECFKQDYMKDSVGAVLNIGYENSTVSIFNKGILTNTKTYQVGTYNIISDICYIKKLDEMTGEKIYNEIALGNSRLSNPNEYRVVTNLEQEKIKLDQYEISEITEERLTEILNLAKKQINILTKKEISYIIVTGGLAELKDFSLTLENVFGRKAVIGKMNTIGVRDNSYSSALGLIKCFDSKVSLKGKAYSIFNESELEEMNNGVKKVSANNSESLLGKVFGYFFEN